MKENIHPRYFEATAKCACGNELTVGSTRENISVEICSKCHPFYTGDRQRIVDTTGRVDRFKKKYGLQ
jgi:large subunit ribosomal protein L31